ncbi:MAG: Acetyl-CoA:oxalate CoA-transferase [Alphaproteobacteria bacterium MarineAlpha4_Bin2]|nr:MAG: Acetyl-CoA:oxalate CoA-transferase [Alphaproteobacteria bacterium MarineAlpha4_Bin2]
MLPLEGCRILAVEQYGAGPWGTQYLADLGAEVIKIENPRDGGDMARPLGPYFLNDGTGTADSQFFQSFNRNKKSLTLDLLHQDGKKVFLNLVKTADAVTCNLRGDVPDKLGLTYETLGKVNESIVCCHLTAYGREGERATWPGYDYLMQAEAGWFSLTGEPNTPPARFGLSVVDLMTGLLQACATTSAIIGARARGKGRDIDVSLFDLALANLSYPATWFLNSGHIQGREPRSGHPSLTPCGSQKTKDGWIFLMCNKEKFWPILCKLIGNPEWGTNKRYTTFKERLKHREEITDMLDTALSARTTSEWLTLFAGKVPSAPILDIKQGLENPYVASNGRIQELTHQSGERFRLVNSPIRCAGDPTPANSAPLLGEHTEDLLSDLGIGIEEFNRLRTEGVI